MPKYVKLEVRRPVPQVLQRPPPARYAAFVAHAHTFSPWMRAVLGFKSWLAR